MKIITLLLFLFSGTCIAQTTAKPAPAPATKPSTTDCPTWRNKPNQSKAAYYEALRHKKPVAQQQGVSPKPKPVKTKEKVKQSPKFSN
jgi:hypothetical protein